MNGPRRSTLHNVVETFAPPDARMERVADLAAQAIDALSPARHAEFGQLLDLLALPMRLPAGLRAGVLKSFADSPVPKLRTGFAALKRLTLFLAYAESEPGSGNPLWPRLGYPGPRSDVAHDDVIVPLSEGREGERVAADVLVIGSGAGGGIAASVFARAGKRVVVLEAGGAYDARSFTQRELSLADLYLERGLASNKDLSLVVLAGATLGGGTAINWCTSFRLAERVADEWQRESGIAALGSELDEHYGAVESELGIVPLERHNANNAVIADGCAALGKHAGAMPRNAPRDCGAGCGYCGLGCSYAKKRSTARVYLPQVARNGAIYAAARVERIVLEGARAKGALVAQTLPSGEVRRFSVEADTVVVSAGSLRTPGLLARSGVTHPLLGKRLYVHPVASIAAVFPHDVVPWEGPMQSAYSDAYNYLHDNYGAKIEAAPAHPGLSALALPWRNRTDHATLMQDARRTAVLIAVTRDRDPGSISLDDEATIAYRVSPFDGEHLLSGIVGMVDIAFAAGAERVSTLHNAPIELQRETWNAARREAFDAELRRIGFAPNRQPFFSAHQMGTAAMGSDPRSSVVDPQGRVWGYDNLLVADASLFPQSSGVNPMLTIFAMARRVATLAAGVEATPAALR